METKNTTFLDELAKLVEVLIAESTELEYIVTYQEGIGRQKAGTRRKVYLFSCLNCKAIGKKKSRAKYCSDRCRKEAERKRVAAALFFKENQEEVLQFLKQKGLSLVEYCDRLQ